MLLAKGSGYSVEIISVTVFKTTFLFLHFLRNLGFRSKWITEEALMKPLYKCHLSDGFYFRQNHVTVTGHVIILITWLWHTERKHFHHSFAPGNITICPAMNINFLFVGGASIFAKFLSWRHFAGICYFSIDYINAKQSICTISMLFNGTCLRMFSIDGAFPVW